MSYHEIIKAWKDPEYRAHLSRAKRALLPENPAGMIELNDEDLYVAGAAPNSPDTCRCETMESTVCELCKI